LLRRGSEEGRDTSRSAAAPCAPTKSTLTPRIKIETTRKLMAKDLWKELTMLGSFE
jgi:hypothetical protein